MSYDQPQSVPAPNQEYLQSASPFEQMSSQDLKVYAEQLEKQINEKAPLTKPMALVTIVIGIVLAAVPILIMLASGYLLWYIALVGVVIAIFGLVSLFSKPKPEVLRQVAALQSTLEQVKQQIAVAESAGN
ncbi:MAG: DUF3784 domain-containing protein [Propionibacteriaceae bacterium]|nr:DUF3784 domain-containing protein [Propionibacteriaceae bacterium]